MRPDVQSAGEGSKRLCANRVSEFVDYHAGGRGYDTCFATVEAAGRCKDASKSDAQRLTPRRAPG
jgi:hypothetical protein